MKMNNSQSYRIDINSPDITDIAYIEALQEISTWPEWKVESMLDTNNDWDTRLYKIIIRTRAYKIHA